jgi:hypothetical protein
MYIKISSVTRTKCPIAMYKISKSEIFGNIGPVIKTWPTLEIFYYSYIHK